MVTCDSSDTKPRVRIYTTHHADFYTIDNPIIENIRAACQYNPKDTTMRGNDEGENIAERSKSFCELTTQYWVWKNIHDLDYYGCSHYRRFISFNDNVESDIYANVYRDHYSDSLIHEMGYDRTDLEYEIAKYDIILTEGWDVTTCGFKDVYDQYANAMELNKRDIDLALEILYEKYPEYKQAAEKYLHGKLLYPCNIFIMKKAIFEEYNEWLFDILFELEKRADTSSYSDVQYRMIGHVAERLLGIFVTHQVKTNNYRMCIKKRFIINNMSRPVSPSPAFADKEVPIIFAANSNFAPYTASALLSLSKHSSDDVNYDVFVLYTELGDFGKNLIRKVVDSRLNFSVRFIDVTQWIEKYELKPNAHTSVETFYRLLAPELFENFSKVLYLDGDLIILDDVSKLYNVDMGNNLIAGVIDPDFIAQYNGGRKDIREYADTQLGLKDPFQYLQAGVLLMNLDSLRDSFESYELVELGNKRDYIYGDQDIINIACQGRIQFLDMTWNVMHFCNGARKNMLTMCCPRDIFAKYLDSRKNPKIIHYAGYSKPWNDPRDDLADVYWEQVRGSCIYEVLIERMLKSGCSVPASVNSEKKFATIRRILWAIPPVRAMYLKMKRK